jgi:hypothetical protein
LRNAVIFNASRFPAYRLTVLASEDPDYRSERPRTYAECQGMGLGTARRCPFVSCGHHLALDVDEVTGSIHVNPDAWDKTEQTLDITRLDATCALGEVARHPEGLTLEEIGRALALTRERVRQLETKALDRARNPAAKVDFG